MRGSPPWQYLLYNAAIKLFGTNTSALGEPISATFARAMVDGNNNVILTPAQVSALGTQKRGIYAIPQGVDTVTLTGLALIFTPIACVPSVMTNGGQLKIKATPDYSTLSPDGCVVNLDGVTDRADYVLAYYLF
jgi:hypothetical protein